MAAHHLHLAGGERHSERLGVHINACTAIVVAVAVVGNVCMGGLHPAGGVCPHTTTVIVIIIRIGGGIVIGSIGRRRFLELHRFYMPRLLHTYIHTLHIIKLRYTVLLSIYECMYGN